MKNRFATLLLGAVSGVACLLGLFPQTCWAGGWGLSLGYNNPAGANIGGNLIYIGQDFAFEIGVGSVAGRSGENATSGSLSGDIDGKILFGSSLRPYLEAGLGLGFGAGVGTGGGAGAQAGNPFLGAGVLFDGSRIFGYVAGDYTLNTKYFYPVIGLGVKF